MSFRALAVFGNLVSKLVMFSFGAVAIFANIHAIIVRKVGHIAEFNGQKMDLREYVVIVGGILLTSVLRSTSFVGHLYTCQRTFS